MGTTWNSCQQYESMNLKRFCGHLVSCQGRVYVGRDATGDFAVPWLPLEPTIFREVPVLPVPEVKITQLNKKHVKDRFHREAPCTVNGTRYHKDGRHSSYA